MDDVNKLCNKIDGRGSIHGCSKLYQAGTELGEPMKLLSADAAQRCVTEPGQLGPDSRKQEWKP